MAGHGLILRSLTFLMAMMAFVVVLAACGSEEQPTEQPDMNLESLVVGAETTGGDVVDRVSEAEGECLSEELGDGFKDFESASLMTKAEDDSTYGILGDCLQEDNAMVLGASLMSAKVGGWSDETRGCVTGLARQHPELVYLAMELPKKIMDTSHPGQVHAILLDLYQCLNTSEKVAFLVAIGTTSVNAAPFSGQHFLDVLPESEVECMRSNLPAPIFAMIANAPSLAGGELSDATPPQLMACLSQESLLQIPAEVMIHGLGATSESSHACIVQFTSDNPSYITLMRTLSTTAQSLGAEEFVEIAEGGFSVFSCMTDEELTVYQETFIPLLIP